MRAAPEDVVRRGERALGDDDQRRREREQHPVVVGQEPLLPPAEYANRQLPDPAQEAKAQALMDEIRCLVCQGESVADSPAEMAGDMRSLIRTRIQAGESPEQIREWLISRYGAWVTFNPPFGPATVTSASDSDW